jgi:hypothetical protein
MQALGRGRRPRGAEIPVLLRWGACAYCRSQSARAARTVNGSSMAMSSKAMMLPTILRIMPVRAIAFTVW